jgi:hypothetical protein
VKTLKRAGFSAEEGADTKKLPILSILVPITVQTARRRLLPLRGDVLFGAGWTHRFHVERFVAGVWGGIGRKMAMIATRLNQNTASHRENREKSQAD